MSRITDTMADEFYSHAGLEEDAAQRAARAVASRASYLKRELDEESAQAVAHAIAASRRYAGLTAIGSGFYDGTICAYTEAR